MKEEIGSDAVIEVPDQKVLDQVDEDAQVANSTALITRPVFEVTKGKADPFLGTIRHPWLQIAHGVGGLFKTGYSPGDLVLAKEHLLYYPARIKKPAAPPLNIIILAVSQYFKQYLTRDLFDAQVSPAVFRTEAEAQASGFTTMWEGNKAPTAPAAMTWLILIKKPEDIVCQMFCIDVPDDGMYAPAWMALDKSAYNSVKDHFGSALNYACRERGISSVRWELYTKPFTARTGNETWTPRIDMMNDHLTDKEIANVSAAFTGSKPPETED